MAGTNGQVNEQARRQGKMLLMAPIILVPLLALCFHGLGGGRGIKKVAGSPAVKGMNMTLPEAHLDQKKNALNKRGLYDRATADSMRMVERRRSDPYFPGNSMARAFGRPDSGGLHLTADYRPGGLGGLRPGDAHPDAQAQELLGKLDMLKGMLGRPSGLTTPEGLPGVRRTGMETVPDSRMVGVPVGSLPSVSSGSSGPLGTSVPSLPMGRGDPDLDKLSGMLDKILRIQNPERAADTVVPVTPGRPVGVLSPVERTEGVDMMASDSLQRVAEQRVDVSAGFSDLDDQAGGDAGAEAMVQAVVAQDQTLVSGESLTFRLIEEAVLNGVKIPVGTLFSGKASLSGERLQVSVTAIRVGARSVPVALEVLDQDGIAGILERGSINREVAKESSDEAVGTLASTPIDGSPAGQAAAAAGVQAARTLFSRKIRMVRVSVKAGYRVLLRNTKK